MNKSECSPNNPALCKTLSGGSKNETAVQGVGALSGGEHSEDLIREAYQNEASKSTDYTTYKEAWLLAEQLIDDQIAAGRAIAETFFLEDKTLPADIPPEIRAARFGIMVQAINEAARKRAAGLGLGAETQAVFADKTFSGFMRRLMELAGASSPAGGSA